MVRDDETLFSSRRVLVAEDDREMRTLLRIWLESNSFDVTECPDGRALFRRLVSPGKMSNEDAFDAIVADIRLPGMLSLDAYRSARLVGHVPPAVFLTAFPSTDVRQQIALLGGAILLSKPFTYPGLMQSLRQVMGAHREPTHGE